MSQQKQKSQESNPNARWRLEGHQRSAIACFFGELVATAVFVFIACMGCVETPLFQNSHFRSGLTFGLAILIAIQCFGSVSGAHLNPAITLAAWLYGAIGWIRAIAYFVAQAAGALIGYGLLVAVLPGSSIKGVDNPSGVCVTVLAPGISVLQGVFIEFLITCCLVMVACSVWDPRNAKLQDSMPVRFGLTVSCLILTAVGISVRFKVAKCYLMGSLLLLGSLHGSQHESDQITGSSCLERLLGAPLDLLGGSFGGRSCDLADLSHGL